MNISLLPTIIYPYQPLLNMNYSPFSPLNFTIIDHHLSIARISITLQRGYPPPSVSQGRSPATVPGPAVANCPEISLDFGIEQIQWFGFLFKASSWTPLRFFEFGWLNCQFDTKPAEAKAVDGCSSNFVRMPNIPKKVKELHMVKQCFRWSNQHQKPQWIGCCHWDFGILGSGNSKRHGSCTALLVCANKKTLMNIAGCGLLLAKITDRFN